MGIVQEAQAECSSKLTEVCITVTTLYHAVVVFFNQVGTRVVCDGLHAVTSANLCEFALRTSHCERGQTQMNAGRVPDGARRGVQGTSRACS